MGRVYRVLYSRSKDAVTYRKVFWSHSRKSGLKGFASIVLLSVGTFMLLPTPEDVIEVGGLATFLTGHYGISASKSLYYALLIIKGSAGLLIGVASILGGSYIRDKIRHGIDRHRTKLADWIRPK